MAELGLCSRREADDWIDRGWVKVNGEVAPMGVKVTPADRVEIDKAAQGQQATRVTILLHKPMGYVSGQAEDGHEPAVVLVNPRTHWREDTSTHRFSPPQLRGLAPPGQLVRIDDDDPVTTNVQAVFPPAMLARLRHGLSLDGQPLKPARVDWQNPEQLRFVLTEGKTRQIRRMCEQVGLKVVGLKRIRIGRVVLGALPAGQWRYLGENERF